MTPHDPQSALTLERPDLWHRALTLATATTGMLYLPKLPLADGTIYACGGGGNYVPPTDPTLGEPDLRKRLERLRKGLARERRNLGTPYASETWERWIRDVESEIPPSPEDARKREISQIKEDIKDKEIERETIDKSIDTHSSELDRLKEERVTIISDIKQLESKLRKLSKVGVQASSVVVPEGAMEWLLHEVGHYVAASDEERLLPNYGLTLSTFGHDGDREWEAWGFEEIVMAPFGPARLFAPPTQRDGAAFSKAGPMPRFALHRAETQMRAMGIAVEPWRIIYGEWAAWYARQTPGDGL